jgi:hypothetical protein
MMQSVDILHLGMGVVMPAYGVATTLASMREKKTKLPSPVAAARAKEEGLEPEPEPADENKQAALYDYCLHFGPVSLDSERGFLLNQGLVLGTEGCALGVGVETVAKLTSGSCKLAMEASVRHNSSWYDLQPVANPAAAFGNLLLQIQADYQRFVPHALRKDAQGFYGSLLTDLVLPRLQELGWSNTDEVCNPCFIYGRFRVKASIGADLEIQYGETDDDGFR